MAQRTGNYLLHKTGLYAGTALLFLACVAVTFVAFLAVTSAQEKKDKAAPAAPQQRAPAQQAPQKAPGWSVRCTNPGQGLTCKATQTIVLGKRRKRLLSISVSKPTEGKNAAMLLKLPHGLFNPAGVAMGIDGAKPETLVIQTCDAKGCYAGAPITPDKLTAMSKGSKLNVTFQNLKKQKIVVPVPLKGFAEAYKKL
jgi:invasion protein IalB